MDKDKVIYRVTIDGQHDVTITRTASGAFIVQYGVMRKLYRDVWRAVAEAESCAIHALTCAGYTDEV